MILNGLTTFWDVKIYLDIRRSALTMESWSFCELTNWSNGNSIWDQTQFTQIWPEFVAELPKHSILISLMQTFSIVVPPGSVLIVPSWYTARAEHYSTSPCVTGLRTCIVICHKTNMVLPGVAKLSDNCSPLCCLIFNSRLGLTAELKWNLGYGTDSCLLHT